MPSVANAGLADLHRAFAGGTLDAQRLVAQSLERIERLDRGGPALNAVVRLNPQAMQEAARLDQEFGATGPRSPLHGMPVLLKDNVCTRDMVTSAGSPAFRDFRPSADAEIVRLLRDAGAVILGKTNMGELASGDGNDLFGRPRNPHDLERTASGSSGGSAVAVAAGFCPLAIGTDTGGSVRVPAAVNGVVGLRPTRGLLGTAGIIPLSPSFDAVGIFGRQVADVEACLETIARSGPGESRPDRESRRIGMVRDFFGHDADVDEAVAAVTGRLRDHGIATVDIDLPAWLLRIKDDLYFAVRIAEFGPAMTRFLAAEPGSGLRDFGDLVAAYERASRGAEGARPASALLHGGRGGDGLGDIVHQSVSRFALPMVADLLTSIMRHFDVDALSFPTASVVPARIAEAEARGPWQSNLASLAGLPELSVPAGLTPGGLPVGISLLGAPRREPALFRLGALIEQARGGWTPPRHARP